MKSFISNRENLVGLLKYALLSLVWLFVFFLFLFLFFVFLFRVLM